MFLHDGVCQAKIHRQGDGHKAHGGRGEQEIVRLGHNENPEGDPKHVAAHKLQPPFAFNAQQTNRSEKRARATNRHQPAQALWSKIQNVFDVQRKHGR